MFMRENIGLFTELCIIYDFGPNENEIFHCKVYTEQLRKNDIIRKNKMK